MCELPVSNGNLSTVVQGYLDVCMSFVQIAVARSLHESLALEGKRHDVRIARFKRESIAVERAMNGNRQPSPFRPRSGPVQPRMGPRSWEVFFGAYCTYHVYKYYEKGSAKSKYRGPPKLTLKTAEATGYSTQ